MSYGATIFEDGETSSGRLEEKLHISDLFHRDAAEIDITLFLLENHKWESANGVLWRDKPLPETWDMRRKNLCKYLLSSLDKTNEPYQVIHGDLGGNILFKNNDVPVVIDLSPTIAPKKYADAIIISDAIAWDRQPLDSIYLLKPFCDYVPFLKYAIAFRVLSIAFAELFDSKKEKYMLGEWEAYKPVWNAVTKASH